MHSVSPRNDGQRFGPAAGRTSEHSKPRPLAALLAVTVVAAFGFTSAAFADTGDPVSSGSLKFKPSRAFKNQLRRNGVVMRPKGFSLKEGSIDPVTGQGELGLKGSLHFKHRKHRVTYGQVAATLGAHGYLEGYLLRRNGVLDRRPTKLFKLGGGKADRNGFGADIRGVKATLLSSAAMKLNRELGLHSLRRGSAGALSVSEQPQTVAVTGGAVQLAVSGGATPAPGTVASKVADHCISFASGVTAIAPAVKIPPNLSPTFAFSVTGGTISPTGDAGIVQQAGGIQLQNRQPPSMSDPCHNSSPAAIQQIDLADDLLRNYISTHVIVSSPPPPPLGGDHGIGIGANLDSSSSTVSTDPVNHTLTIRGVVVTINGATALILNQVFPQPGTYDPGEIYDPSQDFVSGDLLGTADLTLTTR